MLKGCIQVGSRPDISNTINMVPVDHVARLAVAAAFNPPRFSPGVCHVTSHPRLRVNDLLAALETYGYDVPIVRYDKWRKAVENYMTSSDGNEKEEFAL